MNIIAKEKFTRTAPDKIRILTNFIKGKDAEWAIDQLTYSGKMAAKPLILALKQAKDQIKDKSNGDIEKFLIKEVRIDEGPKLKRRRIKHKGMSTAILKRGSHVTVILTDEKVIKLEKEKNGPKS